jgi:hypothetical protein
MGAKVGGVPPEKCGTPHPPIVGVRPTQSSSVQHASSIAPLEPTQPPDEDEPPPRVRRPALAILPSRFCTPAFCFT